MSLSIALVTPSLNQAGFLRETIDSVLHQEYPALDYLVVDGGSSDGSLAVMRSYGERLRWLSEPDSGQSAAINKGWRLTQGEIVGWVNSDDRLEAQALTHVANFFEANPTVDLVYGDCHWINANSQITGSYPACPYDYTRLVVEALNFIPQPATFFRRSLLESVGAIDESLHFTMDYDYWLRAGLRHRGAYLPVYLAALRRHGGAKSIAQLGRFAAENVRIFERLLAQPDLPPAVAAQRRLALSNVYQRAADSSFWAAEVGKARRYAWQAWRCRPLRLRSLWFWLLFGKTGRRWAESIYGNPYF